jgi:hypothetical protein
MGLARIIFVAIVTGMWWNASPSRQECTPILSISKSSFCSGWQALPRPWDRNRGAIGRGDQRPGGWIAQDRTCAGAVNRKWGVGGGDGKGARFRAQGHGLPAGQTNRYGVLRKCVGAL